MSSKHNKVYTFSKELAVATCDACVFRLPLSHVLVIYKFIKMSHSLTIFFKPYSGACFQAPGKETGLRHFLLILYEIKAEPNKSISSIVTC